MAVNTPWRMGNATTGYIDMPDVNVDGVSITYYEPGGEANAVDGTALRDRTGSVKKRWELDFDPAAAGSIWKPIKDLYYISPGPYEMYDPTQPNLLSFDDRLGDGWVTATGTAVTAQPNMRMAISAAPASVQTAISASPAAANLTPVNASATYTAAITVEGQASFAGILAVYGYTSTPSGSGTQQGSNVALAANGRYTCTFTTGATIVYIEVRITRSAGSANLVDPAVFNGSNEPGTALKTVYLGNVRETPHFMLNRSGFAVSVTEI